MTEQTYSFYSHEGQRTINRLRPGLSGIGSIIFRGEEDLLSGSHDPIVLYAKEIAPYKEKVECWFAVKKSLRLYFGLIFLTVWVLMFPRSKLLWRTFEDLPRPDDRLAQILNIGR